jgi:putative Mg2+ transporter-C (MgtC) family protein
MNPWIIEPLTLSIRLVLALVLGGLIGFERERNGHPAGFRTNILVCLGSGLLMLLSEYGFSQFVSEPNVRLDPARLAAQVIPGIGFLGAGTILRNGMNISGLTTAATLMVVAAIGLCAGAGFYYPAILSTGLVLLSLWVLNNVEKKYFRDKRNHSMKISAESRAGTLGLISSILDHKGIDIRKIIMEEEALNETPTIIISLSVKFPNSKLIIPVMEEIRQLNGVKGVALE